MKVPFLFFIFSIVILTMTMWRCAAPRPDYYITKAGDTITGSIKKRTGELNNEYFVFRLSKNSKPTKFFPIDAKGYTLNGDDFYESHPIRFTKNYDTVGFYRVIMGSKISLLKYKERYFVKDSNGKITELTLPKTAAEPPVWDAFHGQLFKVDYSGLATLKLLMADCPAVASSLDLEYRRQPVFPSIFKKYYRCVGVTPRRPK